MEDWQTCPIKSLLNTNTSPSKCLTAKHLVQVKEVHFESKAFITFQQEAVIEKTNSSSSTSEEQKCRNSKKKEEMEMQAQDLTASHRS